MTDLDVFTKLRALRAFEKRHLQVLGTLEDYDLIREIGHYEELGRPLTMKQLYLLDLASMATVQRRLRRLRQRGAIEQTRSKQDRRSIELRVAPKLRDTFERFLALLAAETAELPAPPKRKRLQSV